MNYYTVSDEFLDTLMRECVRAGKRCGISIKDRLLSRARYRGMGKRITIARHLTIAGPRGYLP